MAQTELSYDPFRWSVQDNPYSYYRRLRAEAPVYHVAERTRNPNLRGYQSLPIRF